MSNVFVCIMGIGTVFVGLICIIAICKVMTLVCGLFAGEEQNADAINPAQMPRAKSAAANGSIPNKQEIVAGVCAVIAEELGTDVSNIKVVSFKKA